MPGDIPVAPEQTCPHRRCSLVRRRNLMCERTSRDELACCHGKGSSQVGLAEVGHAVADELIAVELCQWGHQATAVI
jgi:hypothetical protein